ncbi:MAG: Vgb family protein [Gammaproteobacteria bacterium]
MTRATTSLALLAILFCSSPAAPAGDPPVLQEWKVEWGGRPRDPCVAPDGKAWFVGQAGNYIAYFDPESETFRRYEIEDGTNPHNLIVDDEGFVWYAGNRNGRIGKLNPKSGIAAIHLTGEARDPHTLVFDGKGNIWFTSQQASRIGRLDMKTGDTVLMTPREPASRPYGIVIDAQGNPWVSLFNTSTVVRIDPKTLELTYFNEATPESRSRRIEVTDDGSVWYVDEPRGFLGRIDPANGKVKEYAMPGGAGSRPYALTKDGAGRLWVSQSGPDKKLVAFDPKRQRFVSVNDVSETIRHMMYDAKTDAMWFGTDANQIGRVITKRAIQ